MANTSLPNEMPDTFTFEEATQPKTFSFEEAKQFSFEEAQPTESEILSRPAIYAGPPEYAPGAPRLEPSDLSTWKKFRGSDVGIRLFGTPDREDTDLKQHGLLEIPQAMLKFTTVPPPIAEPIRKASEPLIEKLPAGAAGVTRGVREIALGFPLAPIPMFPKTVLTAFGAEYLHNLPEAKKAYDTALARDDIAEATKIATETVGGSLLLAYGGAHATKSKATPEAIRSAEEVPVTPQPVTEEGQPVIQFPKPELEAKAAEVGPATAEAVKEAQPEIAIKEPESETKAPESATQPVEAPIEQQLKPELPETAYDAALADFRKASKEFTAVRDKYRAKKTDDAEFLAARAKFQTAQETFDTAETRYIDEKNKPEPVSEAVAPQTAPELRPAQEERQWMEPAIGKYQALHNKDMQVLVTQDAASPEMIRATFVVKGEPTGHQLYRNLSDLKQSISNTVKVPDDWRGSISDLPLEDALKIGKAFGRDENAIRVSHKHFTDKKRNEAIVWMGKPLTYWKSIAVPQKLGKSDFRAQLAKSLGSKDTPAAVAKALQKRIAEIEGKEASGGIAASARKKLAEGGNEEGFINIQPAIAAIERKRKAIRDLGKSMSNRNVMDQTLDAADNQATIAGQQARKSLDIGSNRLEREAAMAIVEAGGNQAKLTQFASQARAGDNLKAEAAVRHAQANWTALQPLAQRVKALLDAQITAEQAAGINTEYRDAYVPHIYEMDLLMGSGRPYVIAGRGGGIASGFKKGRTFETVFDAIEAGYKPKSMDVGELVEHRIKVGQRLVNRQAWADSLRSITDPSNNKPIVTDMDHRARGAGQPGYEVAPMGYSPREILPGVRIAVHEGYTSLFDALTGTSKVASSIPGQALLQLEGGIKHGLLAFDTFHAGRMMMRELFLTGKVSYKKAQTLLEYSDADLNRAVHEGLITPDMSAWVQANRPTAQLLIKNGLNVGRVQESLYNGLVQKIPVIGTFNKWVFEKLTRGAMMQSGLIEFERVSRAMPNLSPEQVARKVSRDLNVYFGNLGSQGVFKSKTFQDLARLVALAPNWVESMARTEVKGAYQAAKGLTIDPILHKTILTGSVGKGVAQGVLAMFVGAQILNLITRGKPTWENDESGHKLDAWIPDLTGKSPGFFLSPFSVQAEITHDFLRYNEAEPSSSKLAVAARIAMNKSSPLFRAGKVLMTGKDWDRKQLVTDWDRAKAAGFALVPTPIPLSTLTKENAPPGALQRQLTASMGLKTEPAATAGQQLFHLQQEWMRNNPDPKVKHQFEQHLKETFPESDYKGMREALRVGDYAKAKQEYLKLTTELRKKRSDVIEAMRPNKPMISRRDDVKFLQSLTPQQKVIYQKAQQERMEMWKRFQQMLK